MAGKDNPGVSILVLMELPYQLDVFKDLLKQ